jgi:hypothetical protein
MNDLTGLGWVNLLLGQIWLNGLDLGCGAGRLGRAEDSAQKPNSNKKFFFFFKSVL